MTKLDKTDIDNILLLKKETKIGKLSKVKIKKGNYEIEISSEKLDFLNTPNHKIEEKSKKKFDIKNIIEETNEENIVKSPMVGVVYLSADPKSPPYVKVGQHVKAGDTLLIIEAMKTFNEIKAPKSGVIKKILTLNSQPVEYGDNLIVFE